MTASRPICGTTTSTACMPPSARDMSPLSTSSIGSWPVPGRGERHRARTSPRPPSPPRGGCVRAADPGVVVVGTDDVWVKVARCCTPVPGDEIIGFITRGNGCVGAQRRLHQRRLLAARAGAAHRRQVGPTQSSRFLVQIQVEAFDRNGLLSDITRVDVRSTSTSSRPPCRPLATGSPPHASSSRLADPAHLDYVLRGVKGVDGVFSVRRGNDRSDARA
jgi:guanosine-3',5'-bis(diphosphate) 3'-pyrophosphohydrolase